MTAKRRFLKFLDSVIPGKKEMDYGLWAIKYRVDKYASAEDEAAGILDDFVEGEFNLSLDEGVNALFRRLCGGAETAFDEANAVLWVGDSTSPALETQTHLQAVTNKISQPMEAAFPTFGTGRKATFKSKYDGDTANFAWNEWGIANGDPATTGIMLNRKVAYLGTKGSGTVWTFTVEASIINPA